MSKLNLHLVVSFMLMGLLVGSSGFFLLSEEKPKLKKVPIQKSSPADGAQMYKQYCATCHGLTGKGDGPAAAALKSPPSNIALIARHNNGKFPELRVQNIIEGKGSPGAHGSGDMPVWGPIFRQQAGGDQTIMLMRIVNLTKHIESMQLK